MEPRRDFGIRPRPNSSCPIVEGAHDRLAPERRIESDHISNRAHAPIRPARAPKKRRLRIAKDLACPQCREALALDGAPVRLALVAEECAPVVRNLERDPHAKAYLRYNISTAVCRRSASSSSSRRTRETSARSRGR